MEPQFVRFGELAAFELAPGASAKPLFGDGTMINVVELEPSTVIPLHSHPHEQLGYVLRGSAVMIVDGIEHALGPHDGYVIPGGVEHAARFGPEGATVLDVFQPVREEYRQRWQTTEGETV